MNKILIQRVLPLILLILLVGCFKGEGKDAKNSSSQRMEFHKQGVTIDAKYDPRLDDLIPKYKILTIALTNNGFDILRLNPLKDKWEVIDAYGKKRKAINSLRIKDPSTFSRLPGRVQQLIDYPVGVAVGYSETIDLFFPEHVDLKAFRSVSYYNAELKLDFDMLTNLQSPTQVPANGVLRPPPDPRFSNAR